MANGFLSAVDVSVRAAFARAPATNGSAAGVNWTHATTGIVVMAILQAVLLVVPFMDALPEALRAVVDFAVLAIVTTAVPFIVVGGAALLLGKREQVPTLFLFLALVLAISQLVGQILGAFDISSGTAMIGLLGYLVARAAKSLLGVGWGGAILIGALAAVGSFAASFVFLLLPTGQAMMAAP